MQYLTVSARCTKKVCDLLTVEWDEERLGEPTEEAVLKALRDGTALYDVVDEDEEELASFDGAEVVEVEDE